MCVPGVLAICYLRVSTFVGQEMSLVGKEFLIEGKKFQHFCARSFSTCGLEFLAVKGPEASHYRGWGFTICGL